MTCEHTKQAFPRFTSLTLKYLRTLKRAYTRHNNISKKERYWTYYLTQVLYLDNQVFLQPRFVPHREHSVSIVNKKKR